MTCIALQSRWCGGLANNPCVLQHNGREHPIWHAWLVMLDTFVYTNHMAELEALILSFGRRRWALFMYHFSVRSTSTCLLTE